MIRIVDLDSTVSDDRWRLWLIDHLAVGHHKKYHAYRIHCDQDVPMNTWIVDESPYPVVFLTARPEYIRYKTEKWLDENFFSPYELWMRPNDDYRYSPDLKRDFIRHDGRKIEKAFDDRKDVVEMYQKMGVEGVLV